MCAGEKKGCSTLADEGRYPAALLGKGLPTNAPGERDGSLDLSRLARAAVQSPDPLPPTTRSDTPCRAITKVLVIRPTIPARHRRTFLGGKNATLVRAADRAEEARSQTLSIFTY